MQLSEKIRAFLDEKHFATVATINADGTPQQTVLWYEVQGDEILLNSTAERYKTANLRRDPRLSLCVEDGYNYVTIAGTARLIEDQETAQADIRRLAIRYRGEVEGARQSDAVYSKQKRITIRMSIDRVSPYGDLKAD